MSSRTETRCSCTATRRSPSFALLNDPEKAKKITMDRGGERTVFRGFKELFCIRKEDGNFISAGLRK